MDVCLHINAAALRDQKRAGSLKAEVFTNLILESELFCKNQYILVSAISPVPTFIEKRGSMYTEFNIRNVSSQKCLLKPVNAFVKIHWASKYDPLWVKGHTHLCACILLVRKVNVSSMSENSCTSIEQYGIL